MNATWYDVLGVEQGATADEIRVAWKAAIADLEPTDRRFRACNQAAEVLLDPERRAAYDAEIGVPAAVEETAPVSAPAPDLEPAATATTVEPTSRQVPTWLLAGLAAVTVLVAVAAALVWFNTESETDVEAAVTEARSAAEDALPKLINYNYKTAERDRDQALRLTTGSANDEMRQLWDEALLPNIVEAKASTTSTLVTSGVVRVSDDGEQVQIVVVMDVESRNAAVRNNLRLPFTVTMTEADGAWLVSEFEDSSADGPAPTDGPTEEPTDGTSPTAGE